MMKKIWLLTTVVILMFAFPALASARVRTIYYDQPVDIVTKINMHTHIFFDSEVKTAVVGNENYYEVKIVGNQDAVLISAKQPGQVTNLIVVTRSNAQYAFYLTENKNATINEFDDIVNVQPVLDFKISNLVTSIKKNVETEIALGNLGTGIFGMFENIKFNVIQAVIFMNHNKTGYLIRIENCSDKTLGLPEQEVKKGILTKTSTDLYIPMNQIQIRNRLIYAIGADGNKELLKPGGKVDLYVFVEGITVENSIGIKFSMNSKVNEVTIDNIPYRQQDMRFYIPGEGGYRNVMLEVN